MGIVFAQHVETANPLFDQDLRDLELLEADGARFLYAVNGRGGGISLFRLETGGDLTLLSSQLHGRTSAGTGEMYLAEIGGQMRLLHEDSAQSELLFHRIRADGSLSDQAQQSLPGAAPQGLGALATLTLGSGASLVYGITGTAGRLGGWRLDDAGQMRGAVGTAGGDAEYLRPGAVALTVGGPAHRPFLFLAEEGSAPGLRSYRINPDTGALSAAGSFGVAEGLPAGGISSIASFEAHGQTWVLLGAAGSGSLSLMAVGRDGALSLADHLNDSATTRFGGLTALEVVALEDGTVLVLAAGSDDGIALMRMLPRGQLVHLQSLAHETGLGLENVTAIEAAQMGEGLEIYVTSGAAGGISRFSLDLTDLGQVIAATAQDLHATGGAGDDVLLAEAAGSVLEGGTGADVFLPQAVAGRVVIRDFTPGADGLDLSLFEGLRSMAQLAVQSRSDGIRLSFGDTVIEIQSASGAALELSDLWPGGLFPFPDRVPLGVTLPGGSEEDDGGGDQPGGGGDQPGGGGDQPGGGGDQPGGGGDQPGGGGGDQPGSLRTDGGSGNDRLTGSAGDDILRGFQGADVLQGLGGDDSLSGGSGRDRLLGGAGADSLEGGKGKDMLAGQAGDDRLLGGGGRDLLKGSGGSDVLEGGGGKDKLVGGAGNDRLCGDRGQDILTGGAGADTFVFGRGHGADRIRDFTPGTDLIDLSGLSARGLGFDELEISATPAGTRIDTGAGSLLLEDLRPGQIDADDFLF